MYNDMAQTPSLPLDGVPDTCCAKNIIVDYHNIITITSTTQLYITCIALWFETFFSCTEKFNDKQL